MGGAAFLSESSTVDGRTAALAHSAAEAAVFYAVVLFGLLALATAAAARRTGTFPRWYRAAAAVLGVAMVIGSAGSPLVRGLALVAGLSTYLFFALTSIVLLRRAASTRAAAQ